MLDEEHGMNQKRDIVMALVTAPDLKTARKLARAAVEAKLAACANLIPHIESIYWWQDKIETGSEVLILLKTTTAKVAALEELIISKHPYDTPEFLVVPLPQGNRRYCQWVRDSVRQ